MPTEELKRTENANWMTTLPLALERLKRGEITTTEALAIVQRAEAFRDELKGRRAVMAYYDEIEEIDERAGAIRNAINMRPDCPVVCIFRRPERTVTMKDGPAVVRGIPLRLPSLMVARNGQTPFIELDGRQRVRDWWVLLVDGRPQVEGPKRWIMKNAQGAAMMGPDGKVPGWILLTGLARRRQRHKMRRDRRRLEAARLRARELNAREARRGSTGRYYVGADVGFSLNWDGHTILRVGMDRAVEYLPIGGNNPNPTTKVDDTQVGGVR